MANFRVNYYLLLKILQKARILLLSIWAKSLNYILFLKQFLYTEIDNVKQWQKDPLQKFLIYFMLFWTATILLRNILQSSPIFLL